MLDWRHRSISFHDAPLLMGACRLYNLLCSALHGPVDFLR